MTCVLGWISFNLVEKQPYWWQNPNHVQLLFISCLKSTCSKIQYPHHHFIRNICVGHKEYHCCFVAVANLRWKHQLTTQDSLFHHWQLHFELLSQWIQVGLLYNLIHCQSSSSGGGSSRSSSSSRYVHLHWEVVGSFHITYQHYFSL